MFTATISTGAENAAGTGLAAGTISATEPRYATKIDYDSRFERQRPPGFPSTNRYEVAAWDGQWTLR
jgi:hypothetical protein